MGISGQRLEGLEPNCRKSWWGEAAVSWAVNDVALTHLVRCHSRGQLGRSWGLLEQGGFHPRREIWDEVSLPEVSGEGALGGCLRGPL